MLRIEKRDNNPIILYTFKDGRGTYKGSFQVCENPIGSCCNIDLNFDTIFDTINEQSICS